jgi:outer membrane protein assembly factor BamB
MKLAILTSLLFVGMLDAEDWPQFLGPRRDGTYTGKPLPHWPADGPKVLWKHDIGAGFAGPAVDDGKLFLHHRLKDKEVLDCRDANTGKIIWRSTSPAGYEDQFGFDDGPRAVPTVSGTRVFTLGANGLIQSTDVRTGATLWRVDAKKQFQAGQGFFGFACSPMVNGPNLLINIGGPKAGIIALDIDTGKLRWSATRQEASCASPILTVINDTPRAIFFTRDGVVATDPLKGTVQFTHPWRPVINASVNACTPVAVGNLIFVSTSYGKGATVLAVNGNKFETLWSGDQSLSCHYSSVVHHAGHLFGFHGRQERGCELRCVELKTGKVKWRFRGLRAGSVTLAGKELLVLTERGELVRGPATPAAFRPSARVQLMGATVRAYPALANGKLYVRNGRQLLCAQVGGD